MAVQYRKCRQGHLALIRPQEHDKLLVAAYMNPDAKSAIESDFSMTAWVGNKPVGAAGIMHIQVGTGLAWAMLGADAGPHLMEITRAVRNALDISPYKRIEMRVIYDFEEGHRWARLLGFTMEAPKMARSGVNGENETLYARVKG